MNKRKSEENTRRTLVNMDVVILVVVDPDRNVQRFPEGVGRHPGMGIK